jgi:two-component system sensor histidine kinase/response regulator
MILERAGYEVTACGTAAQARLAFQAGPCDLVIVDIGLPDGNGLDLVQDLRLATGGAPFIFMTALSDLHTRLEGFQLGAQDYICKPFAVEDLLARVRAHLRMKQSRDDLARCYHELERIHHSRQELTDRLVHDLKKPLTFIQGALELATDPASLAQPAFKNLLSSAGSSADFMQFRLDDLLSLGQAEQNLLVPKLAPVNMEIVVSRIQALFQDRTQGVRLEASVAPEAARIETDANLVFHILVNLVANALKLSPRGEAVTLTIGLHHGYPCFEVGDRGAGVSDANKSRIFDKFATGTSRPGMGISLAFCRASAQALGGDIRVEDRPGGGSLFVVHLGKSCMPGGPTEGQSLHQGPARAGSRHPADGHPASQKADAKREFPAPRPRGRPLLVAGFLLLLVSAVGAVGLMPIEKGLLLNEAAERQNAAWETVAGVFREAYLTHDPLPLVDAVAMIKRTYPEARWLCVVDSGGRILASQAVKLFGLERRSVKLSPGLRLLVRPVVYAGANLGRIEIGFLEDNSSTHNFFWPAVWLIAMGLGFLSFLLLLARHPSGPLKALWTAVGIGPGKIKPHISAASKVTRGP